MANTYAQLYIQMVFAVTGRQSLIIEPFREELQKYMKGIIQQKKQKLFAIYCNPDHTHVFVSMKPDKSVASLVNDLKSNSSSFIKDRFGLRNFSWQTGYGAFSYSKSQVPLVAEYVNNQFEQHKVLSFKDEYLGLLSEFEIEYDEKYLFTFNE
ncbi:MAG: IS200/IS605 family transposase [Chitinophagaceae bacterium]